MYIHIYVCTTSSGEQSTRALLKVAVIIVILYLASLLLMLLVVKRVGGHLVDAHLGVVGVLEQQVFAVAFDG